MTGWPAEKIFKKYKFPLDIPTKIGYSIENLIWGRSVPLHKTLAAGEWHYLKGFGCLPHLKSKYGVQGGSDGYLGDFTDHRVILG